MELRQEVGKHLKLTQRRYEKDYNRCIRFVPISTVGDYVFLDMFPYFRLAEKLSASEGYTN